MAAEGLRGQRDPEARKRFPYYVRDMNKVLKADTRLMLKNYIGLPDGELDAHLAEAREKAWRVSPYPCVGMWSFLSPQLPRHPKFGVVKENAKSAVPGSYLVCDVGCGLGQELRALAVEGVSSENFRATDLDDGLWQCGFDLFKDGDRMQGASFISADILATERSALAVWYGKIDVILAGSFLHCFDWDSQIVTLRHLMRLLKPQKGSMVVGWQLGGPGKHYQSTGTGRQRFHHNTKSFRDMLALVEDGAETKWELDAHEVPFPEDFLEAQSSWVSPEFFFLKFSLTRI